MASIGYSGTPLLKKLGIGEETRVLLINPPSNYMDLLEKDISKQLVGKKEIPDLVHLFIKSRLEYFKEMKKISRLSNAKRALVVWVSWYKKSTKIPTDVTEDIIRNHALETGWVDVKVCAIDEQWSGLKLVIPLSKR